jgi:hypothetical protein
MKRNTEDRSVRPPGHAARQLSAMVKGRWPYRVHRVDKPVTWRSDTVASNNFWLGLAPRAGGDIISPCGLEKPTK